MKLRDKLTGRVWEIWEASVEYDHSGSEVEYVCFDMVDEDCEHYEFKYTSLKEFCKEWEDYKPAEPLIKDEKIRKAVRAWAEANDIEAALYEADLFSLSTDGDYISFNIGFADETRIYTIAELCGEEEE